MADGASKPLPTPVRKALLDLRILADEDGGFILEWVSRDNEESGDRWYVSGAQAATEAREFFGVPETAWRTGDAAA